MEKVRPSLRLAETAAESQQSAKLPTLDARVLSSLMIKLKVESTAQPAPADAHTRLSELTRSASIQTLLSSAASLADAQGVPGEAALRQLLSDVLELNELWNQVLLKEGVARLTSHYH